MGKNGAKLLLLFATGSLFGLTFPWPGAATKQFVIAIIHTFAKKFHKKIKVGKNK